MTVREAIGAAVPSAGVGCAFSRTALVRLADQLGGAPFDPQSLTEDYEVGLRIVEAGGTSVFVRMKDRHGGIVCTREHFPESFDAAVKQKARWMVGIALSGWDRLGWHGGIAERWMRLRDRRAALAALVLLAAYLALLLTSISWLLALGLAQETPALPSALITLLWLNACLMIWRTLVRATFVIQAYGWRQGARSIPRTIIANLIMIFAARRAVSFYIGLMRGQPLAWEKTTHRFPALGAEHAR